MTEPVKVTILEREFLVSCPEDERSSLLESAEILSERMRTIRDSGKIVGVDRIAVMAALNIAHEMLQARDRVADAGDAEQRLERLAERVGGVLEQAAHHGIQAVPPRESPSG